MTLFICNPNSPELWRMIAELEKEEFITEQACIENEHNQAIDILSKEVQEDYKEE